MASGGDDFLPLDFRGGVAMSTTRVPGIAMGLSLATKRRGTMEWELSRANRMIDVIGRCM